MKEITPELLLSYTANNNGCCEWTRCYNTDGYPRMVYKGSSNGKVHRIILELLGFDIEGKVVRHTCDNPKCINPEHLVVGTPVENAKDRQDRGRTHKQVTEYEKELVRIYEGLGFKPTQISRKIGIKLSRVNYIRRVLHAGGL